MRCNGCLHRINNWGTTNPFARMPIATTVGADFTGAKKTIRHTSITNCENIFLHYLIPMINSNNKIFKLLVKVCLTPHLTTVKSVPKATFVAKKCCSTYFMKDILRWNKSKKNIHEMWWQICFLAIGFTVPAVTSCRTFRVSLFAEFQQF